MVLSFFFNSRILQTGILQTGPNQFVENQKQIQDNTRRFGVKNFGRNVSNFFLPKRPVSVIDSNLPHEEFAQGEIQIYRWIDK